MTEPTRWTVRSALTALGGAQKSAARGAPAYSRFVNRRIGRLFAAVCAPLGLTPDAVTLISALFTFTGIAVLATGRPSTWTGLAVTLLLVVGYAFDSADGQLARLRGGGTPAGEWLDHVVDAVKVVTLPLAVYLSASRHGGPSWFDALALAAVAVQSVAFFALILTEQLRRARGTVPLAVSGVRGAWVRPVLALPTDYGVQCYVFLLLGSPVLFRGAYATLVGLTTAYQILALVKWYRELRATGARAAHRDGAGE